jgi:hypothetical protein
MSEKWSLHRKRVCFGRQPLELWMFVSCKLINGIWIPLSNELEEGMTFSEIEIANKEYQEAKKLCLFKGFEIVIKTLNKVDYKLVQNKDTYVYFNCDIEQSWLKVNDYTIIDDLAFYSPKLTTTAKEQLGFL